MTDKKKRVSASVDPDVADYLQQNSVNASGLINKLVKQHQAAGGTERAMLQLREEQIQSEVGELENRLDMKRSELSKVRDRLQSMDDEQNEKLDEAATVLSGNDFEYGSMKVSYWADETGLSEEELEKRVRGRWDEST